VQQEVSTKVFQLTHGLQKTRLKTLRALYSDFSQLKKIGVRCAFFK